MGKIVILDAYTANPGDLSWDALKQFGDVVIYDRTDETQILDRAAGAFALFSNKVVISAETMAQLPDLKFIGVLATGYNNIDIDAATLRGITVCNVPGYSTNSVVQTVFAHLLNIVDHTQEHSESVHNGDWTACKDFTYRLFPKIELASLTMGVYGLGNIGSKVAEIANAFGMKVIALTHKSQSQLPEYIKSVSKEQLFATADVVSLNAPLCADNKNFVNAETLALMKPSAIIINTARGGLVDEQALADALNSNKIYAAAVDVLSCEPPKSDNPLLSAKHCYITPHTAWQSDVARTSLIAVSVDNLRAFLANAPINVVNK